MAAAKYAPDFHLFSTKAKTFDPVEESCFDRCLAG
jgi:hypothetical protein